MSQKCVASPAVSAEIRTTIWAEAVHDSLKVGTRVARLRGMKKTKLTVSQSASSKASKPGPKKSNDVPVTKKMLFEVRDELKESISALRMEFKADFHGVKSEIHELRSEIHGIKFELHCVKSELRRMALLFGEANARNTLVLDGLPERYGRPERVEGTTDSVDAALQIIRREYEKRQTAKQP